MDVSDKSLDLPEVLSTSWSPIENKLKQMLDATSADVCPAPAAARQRRSSRHPVIGSIAGWRPVPEPPQSTG
jgi:hypothetical protein